MAKDSKKQSIKLDEFSIEGGKTVNISELESDLLDKKIYKAAHRGLVIACHDVFINYNGKILLVYRDNFPAKDHLWPIGGRLLKGVPAEVSLKKKAYDECGLFLEDIKFLDVDRTLFKTDPFNHGRGTDSLNLVYYAIGTGKIKLNELHKEPTLIGVDKYLSIRKKLHPYVKQHMDFLWSGNGYIDLERLPSMKWGERL
jgi:hypothetical protein